VLNLVDLLCAPRLDPFFDISLDDSQIAFAWNKTGEMASTKLAERNSWDTWEEKMNRKQMADYATDEAERILREHVVPPLGPHQEAELDRILAAAARETVKVKKK
jgi:trimethylamine:corrinoid methyltransferase-like protein